MNKIIYLLIFITNLSIISKADILSWVPPYRIDECKTVLNANFGTHSIEDALTHMALQFWVPETTMVAGEIASTGNIVFKVDMQNSDPFQATSDDVIWFRDWCHQRGVKALLTIAFFAVPNEDPQKNAKNWKVQKSAFMDNRTTFVNALIDTMISYNLDGIDLDLESWEAEASNSEYREGYKNFIKELSDSLKANHPTKHLSISAPMGVWGFANRNWWTDWANAVDAINVMGYQNSYEGQSNVSYRYTSILNDAINYGYDTVQVSFGMASKYDTWGSGGLGEGIINHINEVKNITNGKGNICIWDLDLLHSTDNTPSNWQSDSVWKALAELNDMTDIQTVLKKSNNIFFIKYRNNKLAFSSSIKEIQLYNAAGKNIYNNSYSKEVNSVLLPNSLSNGVYLIKLITKDNKKLAHQINIR